MVYGFLYYVANLILRLYYRKIYVSGLDNIQKDKAYLIASNHPNGFLEPITMACTFPIPLYFLVRGDLFEIPGLKNLMVATHQLPIYRFKDGFSNLRNNQKTIDAVIEMLRANKAILIFAEGSTESMMKLRPLQKGLGRMAQQAIEADGNLEIEVLPVGINYSDGQRHGTEVILNIGTPFSANEYFANQESPAKGVKAITDRTYKEMEKLIINLDDQGDVPYIRKAWHYSKLIYRGLAPRIARGTNGPFDFLKDVSQRLNKGDENVKKQIDGIAEEIGYTPESGKLGFRKTLVHLLILPFALIGFLIHLVPVGIAFLLEKKVVKQKVFSSSIIASVSLALLLLFYVIISVILVSKLGWINGIMTILSFMAFGICTIIYRDYATRQSLTGITKQQRKKIRAMVRGEL